MVMVMVLKCIIVFMGSNLPYRRLYVKTDIKIYSKNKQDSIYNPLANLCIGQS